MKNVLKIYKKDIRTILTNSSVAIITIGLVILPSLYAWFNIKASWDPYGNTNGIKVAVVNEDAGTTIGNKSINLGDKIIDELKKNTQLGWNFVDSKEAENGLNSGKYYASITIPSNFSTDMSSILSGEIKKGQLIYTVNEKINAISPKITDKGASSLAETISKTVVESVSGVIFDTFNEIGFQLEDKLPLLQSLESTLKTLQSKFNNIDSSVTDVETISKYLRDVVTGVQNEMGTIKDTLGAAQELSDTLSTSTTQLQNWSKDISPIIKNDIDLMISISNGLNDLSNGIINSGSQGKDEVLNLINSMQGKLSALKDMNNSLVKILTTIDIVKPNTNLKPIINELKSLNNKIDTQITNLNNAINSINNGSGIASDILNNINQVTNDISSILSSVSGSYDNTIVPTINKIFEDIINISTNTKELANTAEENLPKIDQILSLTLNSLNEGDKGIAIVKENLPKIYTFINNIVDKLEKVNSSKEVGEILKLLQQNPILEKEFLSEPVTIVENKLYSIPNYGSAMTPFYTILSLWVGILLLLSIFSTETHGDYTDKEIYFGKLLLFLTLTILQALIVSLGDIFLLKAYVINPVYFVLINVLASIIFTLIVYSLVSVLGNVGKAIGVVLLVLQVAGSGGTFPIEVTPRFFQILNPFLPFTYGISALRETVGGIYMPNLITDIVIIILFGLIFMIFAIFLKKPINKLTKSFREKFNKSGLGAH